jgi:glutathione S-transferase
MKLYYSPGACSLAPHVLLEELGLPHTLVRVTLAEGAQHAPGYEAVHPLRRVPVLEAGGERLTETLAILGYLAAAHPEAGLLPEDAWGRARALEWCALLASTLHIDFAQVWRQARFSIDDAAHASIARRGTSNALEHLAIVEARLGDGPFALGERYSIVDAYLLPFHRWTARIGLDPRKFVRFTRVVRNVLARPATARALAAEGLEYVIAA